eukprot:159474_1
MAFVPDNTNEKKMNDEYDHELDCEEESIVHADGDHRKPIIESEHKQEDIIKCIGQLEANYKYIKFRYEQKGSAWGTATVITTKGNQCFLLTAAHNIRKKIKECTKCMKYMDCVINKCNVSNCIHCNYNVLKYKIINATKISFRRREIKKHASVYDKNEKK